MIREWIAWALDDETGPSGMTSWWLDINVAVTAFVTWLDETRSSGAMVASSSSLQETLVTWLDETVSSGAMATSSSFLQETFANQSRSDNNKMKRRCASVSMVP